MEVSSPNLMTFSDATDPYPNLKISKIVYIYLFTFILFATISF